MRANLRRLVLLSLLSTISLPVYSQAPRGSNGLRELDSLKRTSVADADMRKAKNEDDNKEVRDGKYWFSRGYALHQSDHYIEAIDAFTRSIGLRYRQATAMYNVACGYALLNDKENALFWLERSLAVGFDRPDLLKEDSDLDRLRSDPRFDEIVRKATFIKKDDKPGKDKTVSRLEEAVNNFEQLRQDTSTDGDEWYQIGSRLMRLRDFDRAAISLARAVDCLGYRSASAMYNLACTYAAKGDRAAALEWLEKAVNAGFDDSDKFRDDPDIASLRSDAEFKRIEALSRALSLAGVNGDWPAAVNQLEAFLRAQPANGRGWFNLGLALHYSGNREKAITAFERAIQLGYKQPTAMYNIACANAMMGKPDAAFEWLEKSVGAGFDIGGYINGDPDLASLRSDSRFKRYLNADAEKHKVEDKNKRKDKDKVGKSTHPGNS
jgi:Flp pilus assembly protein TadD